METKVVLSKQFSLNWRDILRGGLLATLTSVLIMVQETIDKGSLDFNWKTIGMSAIGAFLSYLIKNGVLEPTKVIAMPEAAVDADQLKSDIKEVV